MSERRALKVVELTPPGRGAIATLLVEGEGALDAVASRFRMASSRPLQAFLPQRLAFGHFGGEPGEEVVVRAGSPARVEVHCHGGRAAVAMVRQALVEAGCTPVGWQEWLASSGNDPIATAALLALAEAPTERTAAILLDQYRGALGQAIRAILDSLDQGDVHAAAQQIGSLLGNSRLGLHLVKPWRVVVAGRPNVGKSTLVNTLLGYERVIVDPQPGTTRDLVTATTAIDGWPVELCDTAGLRETDDPIEQAGVELAHRHLTTADLVLLVFDLTEPWSAAEQRLIQAWPEAVVVHNKSDLAPLSPSEARPGGIVLSALTGQGVDELLKTVGRRLVGQVPGPGSPVPFTEEQTRALRAAADALQSTNSLAARQWLEMLVALRR